MSTDTSRDEDPVAEPAEAAENAEASADAAEATENEDGGEQGSRPPPDTQDMAQTMGEDEFPDEVERVYTRTEVEAKITAEREKQLRLLAEYENFRRRTAREKEKWQAEGLEDFVKSLLPVLDSFDKAREVETDDAAREGVEVMFKQMQAALANHEIDVIDPGPGEAFDPRFHEALTRGPSDDHEPGTILKVFEKGYTISGRLVRAARVSVVAEK